MVRVPVYDNQQVATRPVNQQFVEGRAIEGAFGGGQGLMALSQGVGKLGAALREVQELEDMTRAKEAENEFALYMQGAMYGEGGYMLSEGRNAFEGRAGFMSQAESRRREIAGRLKGGSRTSFNEASTMRMLDVNGVALRHAAAGQKAWVRQASAARADLFAQDAWNAIGNQAAVNKHIAAGIMEIREQGALEGLSGEALAVREKAYVSGVQAGVVVKLAARDPLAAAEYLKQVGEQIDPTTRFELEEKLKGPVLWAGAEREKQVGKMKGVVGTFHFSPQVENAIAAAAQKHGVSAQALAVIAAIESKGNPKAKNPNSSAGGLFQQIDGNARQYGVKDRYDAGQSADGAAAFMLDNQIFLRRRLGREPTIGELYLAHQQGAGGAAALLVNPNARAVDIVGAQAVRLNGGDENMTAAQFARIWTGKAERVAGGGMGMEEHIASIKDPKLREATQILWEKEVAGQEAAAKQARDEMIDWVDGQLIGYPDMDLNSLPLDVQMQLGASGMKTLLSYQKSRLEAGGVKTDDETYVALIRQYTDDPTGFGEMNPLEYRDKLSDSDWKQVMGWWKEARGGAGGGSKSDKIGLTEAMREAGIELKAVGIDTTGKRGDAAQKAAKMEAAFRRALMEELTVFYSKNKRAADVVERAEIINRLLLPVVIKKPNTGWLSDDHKGYLFEGRERAGEWTVRPDFKEEDVHIPIKERLEVKNYLNDKLGREPEREEVFDLWFEWQTGIGSIEQADKRRQDGAKKAVWRYKEREAWGKDLLTIPY